MNQRYKDLLGKYYADTELLELLDMIVIDQFNVNEMHYLKTGVYPTERDLLGKLKYDLHTYEQFIEERSKH